MKKTIFYAIGSAVLLIGCQNDINETNNKQTESIKLAATFDNPDAATRAYLGSDFYYRWEQNDALSVFAEDGYNRKYQTTSGDVTLSNIEEVSKPDGATEIIEGSTLNALFPYSETNTMVGAGEQLTLCGMLNTEQTHHISNPSLNSAIMIAHNEQNANLLTFRNACALLKLNINTTAENAGIATIQFIQIESKSQALSGPVTIAVGSEDYTAVVDSESADAEYYIKLVDCQAEGTLDTEYQSFYIALPAGTYDAGDLSIAIYTDNDAYNYATNLKKSYTLGRSQYLELKTTLRNNFEWIEINHDNTEATVTNDASITNNALMTNTYNLSNVQGFGNYDKISSAIEIPEGDYTIEGDDKTVTFAATSSDYMVINALTTSNSGYKNITPPKVTVNNITLTGELCTTCLGIYVKDNGDDGTGKGKTSQAQFNTELNNVNVTNCKIIPFGSSGIGAAVCGYGTIVLNNCNITGTTRSTKDEAGIRPIYDFAVTNSTNTTINGGTIGSIRAWEHCIMTIQGGATVESIDWTGLGYYASRILTINDASISNLNIIPTNSKFSPRVNINADANIDVMTIATTQNRLGNIIIDDAATINKVILDGQEMTLDEFKALL